MQLAHALDDRLVGLLVAGEVERRVLLSELDQAVAHLLQVALALRLNGNLDDRICTVQQAGFDPCFLISFTKKKTISCTTVNFIDSARTAHAKPHWKGVDKPCLLIRQLHFTSQCYFPKIQAYSILRTLRFS